MIFENRARRIGHNVLSLFGSEAISRLCAWATILYMTRHWLEVSAYGQYATAVNWITIFITFSDLGFNVLVIREVAHRKDKSSHYLRNVMSVKLFFSSLFIVFMAFIGWILHYEPILRMAMIVISLRLFFEAISAAYVYLLQAHELMVYQGLVSMSSAFIRMTGVVLTIHFGGGVVAVCWVWVIESAISMIALVTLGIRNHWKPDFKTFQWKEAVSVLGAGVPLAAFGTFQMLYNRVDSVILKSLSGNEAVAYYDLASRLLLVVLLASNLFSVAVLPSLSAVQDNRDDFAKLAGRTFKSFAIMGIPMVVGGFLLAKPLMALLFDSKYSPSGGVFSIMSFYIIFYYLMKVPVNILAIKHTGKLIQLYSGMFVANLALNFLLIPKWGYMGGAYAMVICGILELAAGLWMIRDYFSGILTPTFFRGFGLCLLAAAIMGVGIYLDPRIYWLVLGPVVYSLGLLLFRVLDESDWNSIKAILKIKKA